MRIPNLGILVLTVLMGTALSVSAQVNPQAQQQQTPDFSEEKLETFVDVNMEVQEVQMEGQERMKNAIQEEGLDIPTYSNIAKAKQSSQGQEVDASEEDMKAYEKAQAKVESLQTEIQSEMRTVVEENDISIQEFQQVRQAYQTDPELKEKITKIERKKMMEQKGESAPEK